MIEERLQSIEERIAAAPHVPAETKAELQALLAALWAEIAALPASHGDGARSIAAFAEASAHEATRQSVQPQLLEAAVSGLRGSVQEFETSHPDLAAVLNRIAAVLANMGI